MYVVALTQVVGEVEKEAAALAPLFGVLAYDVRRWLTSVLPHVVFQGPAESHAVEAAAKLRTRGHGALVLDTRDVVAGADMVQLHRFVLGDREIVPNDDSPERLAYDEIASVVVVARRFDVVRRSLERVPEPRAIGRPPPRPVALEQHMAFEHVSDRAAYLFPVRAESRRRPWVLHEREARYLSLGAQMQSTQRANFLVALDILRARAPSAIFDDRFVASPRSVTNLVQVRGHESPQPEPTNFAVDLQVYALATWLAASHGGPYR